MNLRQEARFYHTRIEKKLHISTTTKYYYAYIENHSYDDIVPETIKAKQNPIQGQSTNYFIAMVKAQVDQQF